LRWVSGRSGLSQTAPTGCQLRVWPDPRPSERRDDAEAFHGDLHRRALHGAAVVGVQDQRVDGMRRSRPIEISLAGWFSVRPAGVFAFVSAQNELSGDSRMSSL